MEKLVTLRVPPATQLTKSYPYERPDVVVTARAFEVYKEVHYVPTPIAAVVAQLAHALSEPVVMAGVAELLLLGLIGVSPPLVELHEGPRPAVVLTYPKRTAVL